jgi:hypothetical protein
MTLATVMAQVAANKQSNYADNRSIQRPVDSGARQPRRRSTK